MRIRNVGIPVRVIVIAVACHHIGPVSLGIVVFVVPEDIPARKVIFVRQAMVQFDRFLARPAIIYDVRHII
jgi:hypothetical protein